MTTNPSFAPPLAHSQLDWTFSTLGCPDYSLDRIFSTAAKFGISSVELRSIAGELDLPAYAQKAGWLNENKPTFSLPQTEVQVIALNSSLKLNTPPEEAKRELLRHAPLMDFFKAKHLRVFDGELEGTEGLETAWRWLDHWSKWRHQHQWNFDLAIETHSSLLELSSISALFSRGHENVGLLWDSHHTWRKANVDPIKSWRQLQPWITHIHVKDSISQPSNRHPYTYVLPGTGEMKLGPLLAQLTLDEFQGPVSLEWEKLWHPYLPEIEAALNSLEKFIAGRMDEASL